MKKVIKQSRNSVRHATYASLGAESKEDKDRRNTELQTAMALTSERVFETKLDREEAKFLNMRKTVFIAPMAAPAAQVSAHHESRAAKRARLKASRSKTVRDTSHPTGDCGNIGCSLCRTTAPRPGTWRRA